MAPLAVFRCDASPGIGGGHAVRSLALAETLRESSWAVTFAGIPETIETVPAITRSGFGWVELSGAAENEPAFLAEKFHDRCDVLIVDHYGRGDIFETACRGFAPRILSMDDTPGRTHDCDLLLDPTPGRKEDDYAALVPAQCRLLLGAQYALLRGQFAAAREQALARRANGSGVARILVSLGATDPTDLTGTVLRGIEQSGVPAAVDVAMGRAAPNLSKVQALAARLSFDVKVHGDVEDMAELMAAADIAIGAAGSSSFERCCMGLPSLVVVAAENQRQVAAALEAGGAAVSLGEGTTLRPENVAAALRKLAGDETTRMKMSRQAAALCDGRGAARAAIALAPEYVADGKDVTLRPATIADGVIMLEWQRHPETRRFFRNSSIPTEADHLIWLKDKLADHGVLFSIVLHGKEPVGVVRLDRIARQALPAYEVSILIDPDKRGLGLGRAALRLVMRLVPEAELFAEVHPDNATSHSLFLSAGFRRAGSIYRHEPLVREART